LSDVADDVVEITQNFTGLNKATEDLKDTNTTLVNSSDASSDSLTQQSIAAGATAGAIQNSTNKVVEATKANKLYIDGNGLLVTAQENVTQGAQKQGKALKDMTAAELADYKAKLQNANANRQLAVSSETATVATTTQTVATQTLTVAQRAATFATNALKIALASLGIGLIIIAITELISLIGEYVSGTKAAEAAQKKFNDELERTNDLLDLDLKAAKRRQDLRTAELKARGASEEQFFITFQ